MNLKALILFVSVAPYIVLVVADMPNMTFILQKPPSDTKYFRRQGIGCPSYVFYHVLSLRRGNLLTQTWKIVFQMCRRDRLLPYRVGLYR
jgi:hypothetical protein